MNEVTSMTENWSLPWHNLQRSLAREVHERLPKKPLLPPLIPSGQEHVMNSWLVRALGGPAALAQPSR